MRAPTSTTIHEMQRERCSTGCAWCCNSEPETWHIQTPWDVLPFPLITLQAPSVVLGMSCAGPEAGLLWSSWLPSNSGYSMVLKAHLFLQIHYLLSQKKLKSSGDWQRVLEIFRNWCAQSSINKNRFSAWRAFGLKLQSGCNTSGCWSRTQAVQFPAEICL